VARPLALRGYLLRVRVFVMRTMFVAYWVMLLAGLVGFAVVGALGR
jgi:hypothetical protein